MINNSLFLTTNIVNPNTLIEKTMKVYFKWKLSYSEIVNEHKFVVSSILDDNEELLPSINFETIDWLEDIAMELYYNTRRLING